MAKKIIFSDLVCQYPVRYSVGDLGGGLYSIVYSPGTISTPGTPISASNLNAIADEVLFKLKDTSTSTTTYTADIANLSTYYEGLTILFKPANTNTGASTINISGIGAVPIKKTNNSGDIVNLEANDLIKNKYSTMTYDGSEFLMNNPSADLAQVITDIQNVEDRLDTDETNIANLKKETIKLAVLTGSNNAYGATISTVTSYTTGLNIDIIPNVANTGACTLNVNGLGAKNLTYNGVALTNGFLQANKIYRTIYNGMSFEIQPSSSFTPTNNGLVQTNLIAEQASKLQTPRTISLTGDATGSTPFDGSANKSITVVLANSGATAGTYTKLTIDAKGRVISATNLSAADIPNLDWSKIASGKPTTLAGYGVTDAVSKYIILPSGTDLNTVVTSGFYGLDATSPNYTNLPPNSNVSYGQLIVSRGSDTVFQIITGYNNNEYYMRQGAKGGGTDTNFTTWQPWRRIWHDGNFDPDTKTKRFILTGQLQNNSYVKSVIALCELTNTNPNFNSYSSGIISFHRFDGTTGGEINSLYVGAEKKYNTSIMNYFGLGLGKNIENLRPCTFTYNGKKYGGVEFYFAAQQSETIEFNGSSNFGIFGLDYYNTNTSTVLNQEIYDSLEFDTTVNKLPNLVYNNEKVITHEEQGGINLLSNGSFDNGLNSWTKNNTATLSIISDEKFSKCCKIVTSVQGGGIYNSSPSAIKNDAGTYVYSAWLKADAPLTIAFGLDNNRQTITLTTEWTRYYFIQNKNPGANNILSIFSWDTSGSTVTFYVANAQVETGTMITDWKPSVEDNKTYSDNKILSLGTTTNSGNAYTLTAPTGFTLQDGQLIVMKFNAASSGAITINVGGTGAKSVKDYFGNSITNVRANLPANLVYESTSDSFILLGKGGGGDATEPQLLIGKKATVDTGPIVGTMPNNGSVGGTITTEGESITIPLGYTTGGTVTANYKEKQDIFNYLVNIPSGTDYNQLTPLGFTKGEGMWFMQGTDTSGTAILLNSSGSVVSTLTIGGAGMFFHASKNYIMRQTYPAQNIEITNKSGTVITTISTTYYGTGLLGCINEYHSLIFFIHSATCDIYNLSGTLLYSVTVPNISTGYSANLLIPCKGGAILLFDNGENTSISTISTVGTVTTRTLTKTDSKENKVYGVLLNALI